MSTETTPSLIGNGQADTASIGSGPVHPVARTSRRPVPFDAVRTRAGFIGELQRANGETSVVEGEEHLRAERAWDNFRNAAAGAVGEYFGPVFEDGEVYKWLEAVAWERGRAGNINLDGWLEYYTELVGGAQSADGYLNTFFEAAGKRTERYERLDYDHEIFNMGAMIQAAVAQYRSTGRDDFLEIARRAADHMDATFGPGKRQGTCGHPVAEMALVELYRTTKVRRYLDLAKYFVEFRGRSTLANDHFGPAYFSDRVPVRETISPEGHAVRAVYLASGATDVAIETGDDELLERLKAQWDSMVGQKMYITGGLGSRWEGEAFGDPFELPSDRAYAETCAAIASMQWSWRLYLATGDPKYNELIERQLYNAVLSGVSLDRDAYFYVNTLQVRAGAVADDYRTPVGGRQHWFGCSCCPTNLMRTVASLHHYIASVSEDALQINQYADAAIETDGWKFTTTTNYPWDGTVSVQMDAAPSGKALELRIPGWAAGATATIGGETLHAAPGRYLRIDRSWERGDTLVLNLPMVPRLTAGDSRVDAARGAVAIERGPLVYAIEQTDMPSGVLTDEVVIMSDQLEDRFQADLLGGVPIVTFLGAAGAGSEPTDKQDGVHIDAVPYFLWANREVGPMKVWIPRATAEI